jgi:hypothetical protein
VRGGLAANEVAAIKQDVASQTSAIVGQTDTAENYCQFMLPPVT